MFYTKITGSFNNNGTLNLFANKDSKENLINSYTRYTIETIVRL